MFRNEGRIWIRMRSIIRILHLLRKELFTLANYLPWGTIYLRAGTSLEKESLFVEISGEMVQQFCLCCLDIIISLYRSVPLYTLQLPVDF
jgi:hypothetical protein